MKIDESSLVPIFMQVARWLEEEILKEHILEGEQVPSTNQFAAMYKINPATARKGFGILADEGVLYKKRGIGMFVCPGARSKIREKARERFEKETVAGLLSEAAGLGITREELAEMVLNGGYDGSD